MQQHVFLHRWSPLVVIISFGALTACSATPSAAPAPTAVRMVATAAPAPTVDPSQSDISALSDEFNDAASLARWSDHATVGGWPSWVEQIDIDTTAPGQLHLVPKASGWYEDYRGVFLYQQVTGDFDVTMRIRVTGKQSNLPTTTFSLSGLMVRAPREVTAQTWTPGGENWVFITTGYGDRDPNRVNKPQIETKTTVDSSSALELRISRDDWMELRVVRLGANVVMFYRFPAEGWQVSRVYERPDFPAELEVGVNAYSSNNVQGDPATYNMRSDPPAGDLVARVDYMRYQRPVIAAAYQAKIAEDSMTPKDWVAAVGAAPEP